jgi:hypothetical protein
MKIAMIKRFSQLQPVYNSDMDAFNKLKNNTEYMVDIKLPRNLLTFKKYWALCKIVAAGSNKMQTPEDADKFLKFKAGHVDYVYTGKGEIVLSVKSIAFENMTGEEWDIYYNSIVPHICEELGCTESEIAENIIFEM